MMGLAEMGTKKEMHNGEPVSMFEDEDDDDDDDDDQ